MADCLPNTVHCHSRAEDMPLRNNKKSRNNTLCWVLLNITIFIIEKHDRKLETTDRMTDI